MIRIYADGNDTTSDGKLILNIAGSLRDIERYSNCIYPGKEVIFNVQDEFEVQGIMEFDQIYRCWLGVPNWNTLRFFD